MVEEYYKYPYSIYQKYFPNGNEEEFDKAFVSFDVSEKEFYELTEGEEKFICLESVIFDMSLIKTPINNNLEIKNTFRSIVSDMKKIIDLTKNNDNVFSTKIRNNAQKVIELSQN